MKSKQRGFTLVELMIAIWFLVCITFAGGMIYIGWHFLAKFW